MIAEKYDFEAKEYKVIELPEGNYPAYTTDDNEEVDCPSCKKKVKFGDTYTSREFYFNGGYFGMPVCESCRNVEIRKETGKWTEHV